MTTIANPLNSDFLNIVQEKSNKVTFITCYGIGSSGEDSVATDDERFQFEEFDYSSQGIIKDIFHLIKDARALSNDEFLKTSREPRTKELCVKIKAALTAGRYVILIGISHGSLIMYNACLRLMCDIQINHEHMKKLRLYTIGSPQYPITRFFRPYENNGIYNLINFYHHADKMLSAINNPLSWVLKFKIPKEIGKRISSNDVNPTICPENSHQLLFDKKNRVVTNFYDLRETIASVSSKETAKISNEVYHVSPINLYPLIAPCLDKTAAINIGYQFFLKTLHFISHYAKPVSGEKSFKILYEQYKKQNANGGAIKERISLISSKQTSYVVRKDAQNKKYIFISKQRVYLSDIRGKYRYIR
jgi:hypothetical protein